MKKTLAITASAVVLIVVAAAAMLGVLTAHAGQQSGLQHRCAKLSPAAARAVADPGYGTTLAKLARCPR